MAIESSNTIYAVIEGRTFFTDKGQVEFKEGEVYSSLEIKLKLQSIGFIIYDIHEQVLKYFKVVR